MGVTSMAHIDDVCGYDPLAQPALIKHGEYNQLAAITDTAYCGENWQVAV